MNDPAATVPPVLAPSTFVGQPRAVALLASAARQPVHAYLLVGPAGSGKRRAALAFGAALVCANGGCGACRDCRLATAGLHPDVRIVERVGAMISRDQASEIARVSVLAPVEGRRKVIVLDEFHLLTAEAAARLLKSIEEPPESTVFVILADDTPPELVTIASRCVRVEFRPLTDDQVREALEDDGVDPATARVCAAAARGNLDRARLLATDPGAADRGRRFADLPDRLDGSGAVALALVDELLGLISDGAAPLSARHEAEIVALDERVKAMGERGSGRKTLEDRHKRELRRHRTDELVAGLAAVASTYRDRLVDGVDDAVAPRYVHAVAAIHGVIENLERNPNETLQLQALFLRLPS